MLSAIHFRNFKALRSATVKLGPCNLFIGPSGSGKTSLIQSLLRLRTLAGLPVMSAREERERNASGPQIDFHFSPPFQNVRATLGCSADESTCNLLMVDHAPGAAGEAQWSELRGRVQSIRAYLFDHYAMALPAKLSEGRELSSSGANLAAVLAQRQTEHPASLARLEAEFGRIMPEFAGFSLRMTGDGRVEFGAKLTSLGEVVTAENLSQGTLYLLAMLTLAYDPRPPAVICIEEADRGVHPRLLREVRDTLYRLSHPLDRGESRAPVQVIVTTHSPYLLDLFRDHPEEIILAHKEDNAATFERLADRPDILAMMEDTHLGDLWYAGVLGGVPTE